MDSYAERLQFRRADLALNGLTVGEAADAVATAIGGRTVGTLVERPVITDVVVRYDPALVEDGSMLDTLLLSANEGRLIPLGAVADFVRDQGPNSISRESVERVQLVLANVSGRDLGAVVKDIEAAVAPIALPHGARIELGGQFESAASATRTLLALGVVVLVGMFLLLRQAFSSSRDAAIVMLNLPLALVGGVVGLYLTGGVLSVATIIGFITLFGIATRNGVMLVSHIQHLRLVEGIEDLHTAVRQASEERLVPILMTALAAGLALVPLAIAIGEPGSEIQAPMAIVILTGLITSTILNMLVLPAVYLRIAKHGWGATKGAKKARDVRFAEEPGWA